MIITDFNEKYNLFENMAIWEVPSLDNFFTSHVMMYEIFEKEYGFTYPNRFMPENKFSESDISVVTKLLDYFGDKHFFVFSNKDSNHSILKGLQDKKIINFGMDINVLHPNKIYVLELDKTKNLQKYDTV